MIKLHYLYVQKYQNETHHFVQLMHTNNLKEIKIINFYKSLLTIFLTYNLQCNFQFSCAHELTIFFLFLVKKLQM
jgi:hypothetical protein